MSEEYLEKMFKESNKIKENSNYGSVAYFNINEGNNKYRVVALDGNPFYKIAKHFGFKDDDGKKSSFVCTMEDHGKCPMCEEYARAKEIDDKQAWRKKPKVFYLMYAANEDGESGVLQLDAKAFSAFSDYVRLNLTEEDLGEVNIISMDKGCYVIISKTIIVQGSAKIPNYACQRVMKTCAVSEEDGKRLFGDFPKLSEINKKSSPKELGMVLDGDFSFMKKDSAEEDKKGDDFAPPEADTKARDEKSDVKKEDEDVDELDKALGL